MVRAAKQLSYSYEGEPPQVNQYCPLIWNPQVLELVVLSQVKRAIVLGARPVRMQLVTREAGRRLAEVARAGKGNVALRLSGIEADRQPGISWEVHVGTKGFTPDPKTLVGIFALFGAGLRDRPNNFHPAEFVFPIGPALRDVDPATLEVTFVPVSPIERGPASAVGTVQPRSPVRIGEVSVIVDSPMPQPPRDEQERLRKIEESQ